MGASWCTVMVIAYRGGGIRGIEPVSSQRILHSEGVVLIEPELIQFGGGNRYFIEAIAPQKKMPRCTGH